MNLKPKDQVNASGYVYVGPCEREGNKQRKAEQERRQGDHDSWLFSPFHSPPWVHWVWLFNLTCWSVFYFKLTWVGFWGFFLQPINSKTVGICCLELHSNQEIPHYICCTMGTPCLSLHQSALPSTILAPTPVILSEFCTNVDRVVLLNTIKIIFDQILLLIKMSETKKKHSAFNENLKLRNN